MTATWLKLNLGQREERWTQMVALSFLFHLAILFTTLLISKNMIYYPLLEDRIYHVELVGAPPQASRGAEVSGEGAALKKGPVSTLKSKTRRITVKKGKTAVVAAKRTSRKRATISKKETVSPSRLIEGAISGIERGATEEETDHLEQALSRIEKKLEREKGEQLERGTDKAKGSGGQSASRDSGRKGGNLFMPSGIGKGIQLYQMEIEGAIKGNWSYPVALLNAKRGRMPEAVILLTVRSDGKILKARFKKRSRDSLFNNSVLKAIERSDPLPQFPPGYRKSYDDVEIRFSLEDLIR
jgi:colicin import membrane protein